MWSKRISLLGLSLTAALLTLLLLMVTGAADARSATDPAQQDVQPQQSEMVCSADLLSYWQLDETEGTEFVDIIGGNNATCSGNSCPVADSGRVGGAQTFDGDDDGLLASHDDRLDWTNTDSFSLELWVKTESSCYGTVFFGKHSFDASWWLGCDDEDEERKANLPAFSLRDNHDQTSEQELIVGDTPIDDGEWHHLAGVRDGTAGEMRLYVDGTLVVTSTHTFPAGFDNENPVTIGIHDNKYNANATIDEVAIHNVALSDADVETHYEKGLLGLGYCNQAPIAENGSYTTAVDAPVSITLEYTDLDGPGPFTFTIVDPPDHGTLSGTEPNLTYTPDTGFVGIDSFTWSVSDGLESSNVATIGIGVSTTGENEPPVAAIQTESTPANTPLDIILAYTDPDGGPGPYTFTIVDGPEHGTLNGSEDEPNFTYTPDTNYVGNDSFTWRVSDGIDDSNEGTVSITVENEPPLAQSGSYTTTSGASVVVQLQYDDPDSLPGPYTFTIVDQPQHGTLSGAGDERTYTPDDGYAGSDSFTWLVNDGSDDSNVATITVDVQNEAPVAQSDDYMTASGSSVVVQLQYDDPDGLPGPYTFTIVDQPQHGALSGTGDTRTYTPTDGYVGTDSFTWRVNDGASDSNLATITIDVVQEEHLIYLPLVLTASP